MSNEAQRFFVTGTGTDIGKTVVCAWLAMHLKAEYWKPIQCGLEDGKGDRETVAHLSRQPTHPERYRLAMPRSPHVAAAAEGIRIEIDQIVAPTTSRLLVEGAGGVFVPINDRQFMIDLIKHLGFPAIVVARGTLGGINHLLLTLEALRNRQCAVKGVVFSGPVLPETVAAVTEYGQTVVLAHLPQLDWVDSPTLASLQVPEL